MNKIKHITTTALLGLVALFATATSALAYPTNGTATVQYYCWQSYELNHITNDSNCGCQTDEETWQYWHADDTGGTPYREIYKYWGTQWANTYKYSEDEYLSYWNDHNMTSGNYYYKTNRVQVSHDTNNPTHFPDRTTTVRNFSTVPSVEGCNLKNWSCTDKGSTRLKVDGDGVSTYRVKVNVSASGSNAPCPWGSFGLIYVQPGDIYINGTAADGSGNIYLLITGDGAWHDITPALATTNPYANNYQYSINSAVLVP